MLSAAPVFSQHPRGAITGTVVDATNAVIPGAAVREFNMQTTSYDASVGRTMGAIINVSTNSGTNVLHGELHYVLRHSSLDAPNFFNNKGGTRKNVHQDHRYGFSAGGPLLIPGVYRGRNRTFWFYVFDDNRFGNPGQFTSTVPTAEQRCRDFSGFLRVGSQYQIYDPFTTQPSAGGRFSRQLFPSNIIPRARLDAVGLNIVHLYPLPNQPGTADGRNNFFYAGKSIQKIYQHLLRLDHAFSENHRVFLRCTTTSGRRTRTTASAPASRDCFPTGPTAAWRWMK